jgi:hypothetical protein
VSGHDEVDLSQVFTALGDVGLVVDGTAHHQRSKLNSVEPCTPEAFYFLATYCLDLARKMTLLYKATEGFARGAHPELARQILKQNLDIYDPKASWKETAYAAERALLDVYGEVGERHERILKEVAMPDREPDTKPHYPPDPKTTS